MQKTSAHATARAAWHVIALIPHIYQGRAFESDFFRSKSGNRRRSWSLDCLCYIHHMRSGNDMVRTFISQMSVVPEQKRVLHPVLLHATPILYENVALHATRNTHTTKVLYKCLPNWYNLHSSHVRLPPFHSISLSLSLYRSACTVTITITHHACI